MPPISVGGDTIQNILWRFQNGELDGVHPKVIVLLAGTNHIGNAPVSEGQVAAVVKGITCQSTTLTAGHVGGERVADRRSLVLARLGHIHEWH
jgi:hypothetical protein